MKKKSLIRVLCFRTNILMCSAILFTLLMSHTYVAAQQNTELKVYTDFLERQNTSAKDYILNLFDKYDIVILCERDHREMTQYDLFVDVLKDERFIANVRNAYFEIGGMQCNEELNKFIHDRALSPEEVSRSVMDLQRNIYGAALWEKSNYSYYIQKVHDINARLPEKKQINIFGLDIGVDWNTVTEREIMVRDSLVANDRDSILASNFISYFKKQSGTGKALVVLNYRHAFMKDLFGRENTGRFIAGAFPGKVANVYINSFALNRDEAANSLEMVAINNGKWDASFIKAHKNNIGFDFAGSPFGNDALDIIPFKSEYTFSQFFTGFVYYTYFPDLRSVTGIEGFVDDDFAPELIRRYRLEQKVYKNEIPSIKSLKENYNAVTTFTYKESPEFGKAMEQIQQWLK